MQLGCLRKKKAVTPSSTESKAAVSEFPLKAAPEERAVREPVVESSPAEDQDIEDDDLAEEEPAPSAEEMAAYLGATGTAALTRNDSKKDDDSLPSLEEAIAQVPAKTRALMDELFRARLEKVKRVDPKDIR